MGCEGLDVFLTIHIGCECLRLHVGLLKSHMGGTGLDVLLTSHIGCECLRHGVLRHGVVLLGGHLRKLACYYMCSGLVFPHLNIRDSAASNAAVHKFRSQRGEALTILLPLLHYASTLWSFHVLGVVSLPSRRCFEEEERWVGVCYFVSGSCRKRYTKCPKRHSRHETRVTSLDSSKMHTLLPAAAGHQ